MNRPVAHLLPRVQSVAVCAKQAQISCVRGPITEPVVPNAGASFVAQFLRPVDVVDVQNAKVIFSTFDAATTQLGDQRKFAPPIGRMLVQAKAMLVPMVLSALLGAKTMLAVSTAALAGRLPLPSRSKIASAGAILSCAILEAVEVGFKRLFAVAAGDCNSALFHDANIYRHREKIKFDIACKRIEDAQRQGDLFLDGAAA